MAVLRSDHSWKICAVSSLQRTNYIADDFEVRMDDNADGRQPFSGTITGNRFAAGILVFFCVNGTSTCYEQPSGIAVNDPTSLSVSNVNLASGLWQIYVQTSAGKSARSSAFTVQLASSPSPSSEKRPLIFIPGIAGSKLQSSTDKGTIWPNTPGYYEYLTLIPPNQAMLFLQVT